MAQQQQTNNTGTSISNVQNPSSRANDTVQSVQWSKEQKEILQDLFEEEEIANKTAYHFPSDESHGISCNCGGECN